MPVHLPARPAAVHVLSAQRAELVGECGALETVRRVGDLDEAERARSHVATGFRDSSQRRYPVDAPAACCAVAARERWERASKRDELSRAVSTRSRALQEADTW